MNVNIVMETKQYDGKKVIDVIKTNYKGTMYKKNDDIYVVYKETSDNEKITSTIKINDAVLIKKFGTTNSSMLFEKDKSSTTRYVTQTGIFIIENTTKELKVDIKESNIDIFINYDINIMELFNGRNEITISISEEI